MAIRLIIGLIALRLVIVICLLLISTCLGSSFDLVLELLGLLFIAISDLSLVQFLVLAGRFASFLRRLIHLISASVDFWVNAILIIFPA